MVDGFAELTLEARDISTLEAFYSEAFGLEVLSREDDRVWLAVGENARLGLWCPGEKEFGDEGGRHVHYAFSAEPGTLDALVAKLRAGEGRSLRGPVEHPGGDRSVYVADPEGNVVEIWDFFRRGEGARDGVAALSWRGHDPVLRQLDDIYRDFLAALAVVGHSTPLRGDTAGCWRGVTTAGGLARSLP